MSSYKVEQVTAAPLNVLGEGPHWDVERQSLYYNDIYGGTIHRYDLKEDKAYAAKIGKLFFILFGKTKVNLYTMILIKQKENL